MQPSIRELPRSDLPRPSVYATGVICGVLAAMVTQILLSRSGIELAALLRGLSASQALPWWLMAGVALLTSAVVVAVLSRLPLPWHRFRLIRWILGAAIVFALAEAGHVAAGISTSNGGAHLVVSLAALLAAALMSVFAAYFAVKR